VTKHGAAVDALAHARTVADAVLYEGYLLYPYRASSGKNQSRWQFGVLGPPGALESGHGEDATIASQFLVRATSAAEATMTVQLRFLHLQKRLAQRVDQDGGFDDVSELVVGGRRWLTWDEATECEITAGPWRLAELADGRIELIDIPGSEEVEDIRDGDGAPAGRLVRSRRALRGELRVQADVVVGRDDLSRVSVAVTNLATGAAGDRESAITASFIGAHLLVAVEHAEVLSLTDPPEDAVAAARDCVQHRCWPVLGGPAADTSLMLVSPIILYDHPELAPESAGELFDATEIDEILTLRVMTMTDEEKAEARATDPKAAAIIDRCDAMSDDTLTSLHGRLRVPTWSDPVAGKIDGDKPWWDPGVDGSVDPDRDHVVVSGVRVSKGSQVRVVPRRRADAQDMFFTGMRARVTAIFGDVDGNDHVAVVLIDDPAADLQEASGRFLYFAPDEIEPLDANDMTEMADGIDSNERHRAGREG
jgi:hypothetical protein